LAEVFTDLKLAPGAPSYSWKAQHISEASYGGSPFLRAPPPPSTNQHPGVGSSESA
jgi:hypothetical protein